jgi:hypothetical protein
LKLQGAFRAVVAGPIIDEIPFSDKEGPGGCARITAAGVAATVTGDVAITSATPDNGDDENQHQR